VLAHGVSANARRRRWRALQKIFRIGPLGAVNGVRMRAWYRDNGTPDIGKLCQRFGIPFSESPFVNCDATVALFQDANADLGLSLGNGYIGERVFSIPRRGMINIHSEVLPRFQGASSVIWPIYENLPETGFTIHQINSRIDGGDILYVEKWPIEFKQTLRETVIANLAIGRERIPAAVARVCVGYGEFRKNATRQTSHRSYTTPSIWQFARMLRNHRRLRTSSLA
jgi:methionyl-tRNA formyltransferase